MSWRGFSGDNRAVAPVVGFIFVIGLLVLLLAMYQAQVVPQQNAATELEHHEDTRNELRLLHNAIAAVGAEQEPRFQSITLGTAYEGRTLGINPPPPAGTIRTEQHNISIANESNPDDPTEIPTQFIEYQPGYSELDIGSTWYEHSVLYLDERDRGNGLSVIEDQDLVEDGNVSIVAVQNEFEETGTGRVTFELYPKNGLDNVSLPEPNGNYTVKIPTRLNGTGYWESQLGDSLYENIDPVADEDHDLLNLSVEPDALELRSVGIHLTPSGTDKSADREPEKPDYSEGFYTDGGNDGSAQPTEENASGEVRNPSNLTNEDGETSTAITSANESDLNVGFALPQTDESAVSYAMRFNITNIDITGSPGQQDNEFGFYLVNDDGDELTRWEELREGNETYDVFSDNEIQNISDNYDNLNLIIDSDTRGSAEHNLEIDFFELISYQI